MLLFVVER